MVKASRAKRSGCNVACVQSAYFRSRLEPPNPVSSDPLLQISHLVKDFPGVRALDDVNLELQRGEVLALIGENGAGKSTLINSLGGAIHCDAGEIRIDGNVVELSTPIAARQAGVGIIYQEFNLVPFLTARENIYLGQARQRRGIIDTAAERAGARSLFQRIGMQIDPDAVVSKLSIAEQQAVEIAKALITQVKILVMDEPSATLTPQEVERLFAIVRDLKRQNIGIIYVSHRLDEVLQIADRVFVLRDGKHVGTRRVTDVSRRDLIEMMVGRAIEDEFPKHHHAAGQVRLRVDNLCWGDRVQNVSFVVRAGEVVGLTGLVGAGRTEVAHLISGAEIPDRGAVELDGTALDLKSPRDAIRAGICLLTEDRKGQGLILAHSIQENFGLPNLGSFSQAGWLNYRAESDALSRFVTDLQIKIVSHDRSAGTLSGGNQQKLVMAKWLQRNCAVLLIDEPTRGIDVGAKYEIYLLINQLAAEGKAIVMISSEMSEILGMSDRILVMRQGRIAGEIPVAGETTQQQLMELAAH